MVSEDIKEEIKQYLKTNENKNANLQYLCNTTKIVLRGMFIAIQAYIKKQEKLK